MTRPLTKAEEAAQDRVAEVDVLPGYHESELEADRRHRQDMFNDYARRTKLLEQQHTGSSKHHGPPGNIISDAIRASVKIRNKIGGKGKQRANSVTIEEQPTSPFKSQSIHAYWSRPPPFKDQTEEHTAAIAVERTDSQVDSAPVEAPHDRSE